MAVKGPALVVVGALVAFAAATVRSFVAVPLGSASETTANASIGDLNRLGRAGRIRSRARCATGNQRIGAESTRAVSIWIRSPFPMPGQ
jgi:hypothetical protein